MAKFANDYGMLVVTSLLFLTTVLYTYATFRLTSISSRAHRLNTQPLLTFRPAVTVANKWISMSVQQEVVNIGLSYVRIESALLYWWPYLLSEQQTITKSNLTLPHYLAPGGTLTVAFELTTSMVKQIHQGSLASLSDLITGHLVYKYRGLDDALVEAVEPMPN
jgi:hypothetical protein